MLMFRQILRVPKTDYNSFGWRTVLSNAQLLKAETVLNNNLSLLASYLLLSSDLRQHASVIYCLSSLQDEC